MLPGTILVYSALVFAGYDIPGGYPRTENFMARYKTEQACRAGIAAFEEKIKAQGTITRFHKSSNCRLTQQIPPVRWQEDLDAAAAAALSASQAASKAE